LGGLIRLPFNVPETIRIKTDLTNKNLGGY
jgi:hypothetical protein